VSKDTTMDNMFKDAAIFNQDLSGWCVEQIEDLPADFATNCPLQDEYYPVWGSCGPSIMPPVIMSEGFGLYPNPITDLITIHFDQPGTHEIRIYTSTGQEVHSEICTGNETQIDLSGLRKGLYMVRIDANGYAATRKMVKL